MKRFHFIVFTLLFYTLSSCNKSDDKPEEPDNTPLQLIKKISRYELSGQMIIDSTSYTYDSEGHLTATVDSKSNLPRQKFIYNGDNLVALINYYINGVSDTLKNPIRLLDGGNTILLDHTRPNPQGGMDTIQITYKWSGNQLLEASTYLHLANSIPGLQKKLFSYNPNGNEYEETLISNGISYLQHRALAYDQKKNYFNTIPRLNYIFGGWGFPDASRSVNNPVKAEKYDGTQVEYIWTYNDKDYPLTMQVKGQNFIAIELYYNK